MLEGCTVAREKGMDRRPDGEERRKDNEGMSTCLRVSEYVCIYVRVSVFGCACVHAGVSVFVSAYLTRSHWRFKTDFACQPE